MKAEPAVPAERRINVTPEERRLLHAQERFVRAVMTGTHDWPDAEGLLGFQRELVLALRAWERQGRP